MKTKCLVAKVVIGRGKENRGQLDKDNHQEEALKRGRPESWKWKGLKNGLHSVPS